MMNRRDTVAARWCCQLVAFRALALLSCSSSQPAPDASPEYCGLETIGENEEIPALNVEEVYDVSLRDPTSDPLYREGIREIFVDSAGVSVFTETSFVRTNLDGEVLATLSYEHRLLQQVRETDDGYAAVFAFDDDMIFCMFGREGPLIFENCAPAHSERFAWVSPYYYFLKFGIDRTPERPDGYLGLSILDASGAFVAQEKTLPWLRDVGLGIHIDGDQDHIVMTTLRRDEFGCHIPMFSSVSLFGTSPSLVATPFLPALPTGYDFSAFLTRATGDGLSAMAFEAVPCERAKDTCAATPGDVRLLSIFDGAGVAIRRVDSFGSVHSLAGSLARFRLTGNGNGEGSYILVFYDAAARPTGIAKWPTAPFLNARSWDIAAIGPGDYVIAFPKGNLQQQDRLVRVRVTPVQ